MQRLGSHRGLLLYESGLHAMTSAEEAAVTLPPHLAAKARNPLQVELATILTTTEPPKEKP